MGKILLPAAVAALVVLQGTVLFPWDSDASFAQNDPLGYAHGAEKAPLESVVSHHPLPHLLAYALISPLEAMGIERPGHMALRILAAAGALLAVALLAGIAGPDRLPEALLLSLPLLSTRGFILGTGTGETVVPGGALCLLALLAALRRPVRLPAAGTALVAALLWRQDGILIVPAVAAALLTHPDLKRRLRTCALFLLATGAATLALYGIAWAVCGGGERFAPWMLKVTAHEGRTWALHGHPRIEDIPVHLAALGAAVAGVHHLSGPGGAIATGAAFAGALLAAAWLLRGRDRRDGRLFGCLLLAIAARLPFYLWFEPQNYEWWLPSLVFLGAGCARWMRGKPAGGRASRAGLALLPALALATLALHLPTTLRLRERNLAVARDMLTQAGGQAPPMVYMTYGATAHMAFHVMDIPHDTEFLDRQPGAVLEALLRLRSEHPDAPFALFFDRFVRDGQPVTLNAPSDALAPYLDGIDESDPAMRAFRHRGRVFALGFNLPE